MFIEKARQAITVDLSEIFKVLGDQNRLRIINLVSKQEICVCMIAQVLKTSLPNVSKHLNKLRYSGVIKCKKISQWCFYSITDSFKNDYIELLDFMYKEMGKDHQFSNDTKQMEHLLEIDNCCSQLLSKN
jgi:ArsR family transcriptional regulator